MKSRYFKLLAVGVAVSGFFSSCEPEDPWKEVHDSQFEPDNVQDYHERTLHSSTEDQLNYESIDIYVDLSDGIAPAWSNNQIKQFFTTLMNRNIDDSRIVTMGRRSRNAAPEDINLDQEAGTLIEVLMNPGIASNLLYAQLQQNLEKIIEGDREAVFISDFEEYLEDGKLDVAKSAIFTSAFKTWMDKGHELYFYRFPYVEGDKQKNLVVVFFTSSTNGDSKVHETISALKNDPGVEPELVFEQDPFIIDFQDSVKTGLKGTFMSAYETWKHDLWNSWKLTDNFESHFFPANWSYYTEPDFQEQVGGNLSQGLLLNTKVSDLIEIKNIKLEVFDISEALRLNTEVTYFEKIQDQVELTIDNGGNKVWSENDLFLPLISEGFDENTNVLRSKYTNPKYSKEELPLVLELDQELFNDWLKNDPENVKVHTKMNLERMKSKYMDDNPFSWEMNINVTDVELNLELLDSYEFIDPTGTPNKSLSESLKNLALYWERKLLEKNSNLYTYYLIKEQ